MDNWSSRLAVFDLETTGVDVDSARIVSACIAVLDAEGTVLSRWDWLADPGVEIPEGASAIHGITTERARAEGRPAAIVVAEVAQSLRVLLAEGVPLVVYNAPYDLSLLDRESRRYGVTPLGTPSPVIDPLVLDKAVDRYRKGKRTLEVTAERYGVALDDAHDAGSDAIAAGRVAQALARQYVEELDVSAVDLHGRQELWYAEQARSFQDYVRSTKGDATYVASTAWPLRLPEHPNSLVDTQPLPRPVRSFAPGGAPLELEGAPATVTRTVVTETTVIELPTLAVAAEERSELLEAAEAETASEEVAAAVAHDAPPAADRAEPVETELLDLSSLAVELAGLAPVPAEVPPAAHTPEPESEHAEGSVDTVSPVDEVSPGDADASPEAADGEPLATEEDADPDASPARRPTVLRIAAAIVTDPAGRTVLVRKAGTSSFMQPGGKIEPGESALRAIERELREELDLELDLDATEHLGSFRAVAANEPDTVVRAEVFAVVADQELSPQGEIEELLWLESLETGDARIAPLSADQLLPLWASRRATLF